MNVELINVEFRRGRLRRGGQRAGLAGVIFLADYACSFFLNVLIRRFEDFRHFRGEVLEAVVDVIVAMAHLY